MYVLIYQISHDEFQAKFDHLFAEECNGFINLCDGMTSSLSISEILEKVKYLLNLINKDRRRFRCLINLCLKRFPSYSRPGSDILKLLFETNKLDVNKIYLYRRGYLQVIFDEHHNDPGFDQTIKDVLNHDSLKLN